jgi:hypothetical protein
MWPARSSGPLRHSVVNFDGLTPIPSVAQKIKIVISRHVRLAGDAEKPCVLLLDDEFLGKAPMPMTTALLIQAIL